MRRIVSILVLALIMAMSNLHAQNAYTSVFSDTNQYGDTLYYYLGGNCDGAAVLCAPNALDSGVWWDGRIYYIYRSDSEWWAGYNLPTGNLFVPDSVTYNEQKYPVGGISPSFCGSLLSTISLPGTVFDNQGRWYHDSDVLNLYWRGSIEDFLNAGSINTFGPYNLYLSDTLVTDLIIPEGVVCLGIIDAPPFAGCQSLRRITLPHSCVDIGMHSFSGCSNLEEFICLSDSMGGSWGMVFENCTSLKHVQLPECRETQWGSCSYSLGDYCFSGCTSLTSIELPDAVGVSTWNALFVNCPNLDTIIMGDVPPLMSYNINGGAQPDEAVFGERLDSILFIIPCGSYETYQQVCKYNNGMPEESEGYECLEYWSFPNIEETTPSFNIGIGINLPDTAYGTVYFDTSDREKIHCDSTCIIKATLNYGYNIHWNDGDTCNPRIIKLTQDTVFTAYFDKNVYAITALSGDFVKGSVTGDTSVLYLDSVILTAKPNYGYNFTQWNDSDTNNPRTVQVTRDSCFTALFAKNSYSITLDINNSILGSTAGNGTYEYLDERTISATPSFGYHFTTWNDGDTSNPRILTLTQDTAFTAMFDRNSYHVVSFSTDTIMGMATSCDTTLLFLDSILLSATPNYGYHFTQWSDGITENPRTVQVTRDSVLTALFAKNSYSVTVSSADTMMGSTGKSPSENIVYLDNVTLTAYPAYGYHFAQWNDGDTSNPRVVTLTQDTAFVASFGFNQYTVTVQSNDTTIGMVTGDGSIVYYRDSIAIEAICTAPHYHFVQWSDGCTETTRIISVTCDTLFTAIFAIDTHTVTLLATEGSYGLEGSADSVPYGSDVTILAIAAEGYHFAEWSNGCRENPYTITVTSDTLLTAIFAIDVDPSLCMVTVQDGHNVLLWNKELPVTHYNLYRDGTVAGEYELIASVPYDSLSQWTDTSSRPMTRSYRYRISGTDSYGYESRLSDVHKTMHLTISQGIGNRWNLVWTEYEGAEYTTYVIYRGTNASNIQQIDVMPSGYTTYTDEEALEGEVYYQVGVMMSSPCTPTKTATISLSNVATNGNGVGISNIEQDGIKVYAIDGRIVVEGADGEAVRVYDMTGRQLPSTRFPLPTGVYMVKVGDYPTHRVVVVR